MIKKILGIAVLFGLMMTAAQAKTFLVDVRTPSEIATTGKVEGALVANYSAPDFVDQFKALGAKPDDDIDALLAVTGQPCGNGKSASSASSDIKISVISEAMKPLPKLLKRPLVK